MREYRKEQGVEICDEMYRYWRDIVKKQSAGPTIGALTGRSMQLFDMCSYDMDRFRDSVRSEEVKSYCCCNFERGMRV